MNSTLRQILKFKKLLKTLKLDYLYSFKLYTCGCLKISSSRVVSNGDSRTVKR